MLATIPSPLSKGAKLANGEGGEGTVYEVVGKPDLLIKIYKVLLSPAKRTRLERLIAAASPFVLEHTAWPLKLVDIGGETGVVMPCVENARPIHQLYDPSDARRYYPSIHWRMIVAVALDVARACETVHAAGFIAADISDTNVLVRPNLHLTLIDCDSFVPDGGGEDSISTIGTPFWLPPELAGRVHDTPRTQNHDNFALARLIFLLLFQGSDPMMVPPGKDPESTSERVFAFSQRGRLRPALPNELTLQDLVPEVAEMFEQAFSYTPATPMLRPSAADWVEALTRLGAALTPCQKVPTHWHVADRPCPWCRMVALNAAYDPFPAPARSVPALEPPRIWPDLLLILRRHQGKLAAAAAVTVIWLMLPSTPRPPLVPVPSFPPPTTVAPLPPRPADPSSPPAYTAPPYRPPTISLPPPTPPAASPAPASTASPSVPFAPAPPKAAGIDIADAQRQLTAMGFSTGGADGVIGPRTREAIEAFRIAAGLAVGTDLNDDVVSALNGPPPAAVDRARALSTLGLRALDANDLTAASRLLAAGNAISPSAETYLGLGSLANIQGDSDAARRFWRLAMQTGPGTTAADLARRRLATLDAPARLPLPQGGLEWVQPVAPSPTNIPPAGRSQWIQDWSKSR